MKSEADSAFERILAEQAELAERLRALEESEALRGLLREQAELRQRLEGLENEIEAVTAARARGEETPADAAAPAPAPSAAVPPPLPSARLKPKPETPPAAQAQPAAGKISFPPREAARDRAAESAPAAPPAGATAPKTRDSSGGIELKLGTYWLVRIGIVMVLTGLVFLANYFVRSPDIGPGVKVFALYVVSALLLGAGTWVERTREGMRNYGQVLAAGGLAAVYFTTYAAHKVPALTIVHSPLLAGVLLLLWAGFMVFLADRKKSQTLAVMGVLLAYYTLLIDRVSLFSLWSALILSGVALAFLLRNRWIVVGFISLAGTYLSFAYWRYPHLLEWLHSQPAGGGGFWPEYGFLICYWAIFTAAAFLSSREHLAMERRSAFAGVNNGAFLVLFGLGMARHYPDAFWIFALVSGAVSLGLNELARRRFTDDDALANLYLVKGVVLVTLALLIKLSGVSLALALAAESSVLLVIALQRRSALLEAGASLSAMIAVFYTMACEFEGPGKIWFLEFADGVPGIAALGQTLFLFFNAWWVRHRDAKEIPEEGYELRACLYVALGIAAAIIGALLDLAPAHRALGFMAAGLLAAAAGTYGRFRLRELALLGQVFSLFGMGFFLFRHAALHGGSAPPLWQTVPALAAMLALVHWAAQGKGLPAAKAARALLQSIFATGFTLSVVVFATARLSNDEAWLFLGGLLALAQLLYGFRMRLPALAVLSPFYHLVAFDRFLESGDKALLSALPLVLLLANLLVIGEIRRRPAIADALDGVRRKLLEVGLFLMRSMALVMFLVWVHRHAGEPWQPAIAGAAALALLALAILRCDGQRLFFSVVLLGLGTCRLFVDALDRSGIGEWQWYLACLAPFCMQQLLRRLPVGKGVALQNGSGKTAGEPFLRRPRFLNALHTALAALSAGLLWLVLSKDVAELKGGFYLTVSWSLLAFGVFAAGWFLRERLYRLLGLGILGAALLRVLAVDVWALDQVARIVSFIVIGVVLLALGFVYTRFQETLRRYF